MKTKYYWYFWLCFAWIVAGCEEEIELEPTISRLSKDRGSVNTQLSIQGRVLIQVEAIYFNEERFEDIILRKGLEEIQIYVPVDLSPGNYELSVATRWGRSNPISFVIIPPLPTLNALSEGQGVIGDQLILVGTHLSTTGQIQFGPVSAKIIEKSDSSIVTQVPVILEPGSFDIYVETEGGTSNIKKFEIQPTNKHPVITQISPNKGETGTPVQISGIAIQGAFEVVLGGVTIPRSAFENTNNDSTLIVDVPAGATSGRVRLRTAGGLSNELNFEVLHTRFPPFIETLEPEQGFRGSQVMIRGRNLQGTSQVLFGESKANILERWADSLIVNVPKQIALGEHPLRVSNVRGTSEPLSFLVQQNTQAPQILGVAPLQSPLGGEISIRGKYLQGSTRVEFNGIAVDNIVQNSETLLKLRLPNFLGTGSATVQVFTDGGASNEAIILVKAPNPALRSVSPERGKSTDTLTLQGTYLEQVVEVSFGGTPAEVVTHPHSELIQIKVPEGLSPQFHAINLTTSSGQSNSVWFELVPPPRIDKIYPSKQKPGNKILLEGRYFEEDTKIILDGVELPILEANAQYLLTSLPNDLNPKANARVKVIGLGGQSQEMPYQLVSNLPPGVISGNINIPPISNLSTGYLPDVINAWVSCACISDNECPNVFALHTMNESGHIVFSGQEERSFILELSGTRESVRVNVFSELQGINLDGVFTLEITNDLQVEGTAEQQAIVDDMSPDELGTAPYEKFVGTIRYDGITLIIEVISQTTGFQICYTI